MKLEVKKYLINIQNFLFKDQKRKFFIYGAAASLPIITIATLIYVFLLLNWQKINNYLIKISVSGDGQVFTTIAASILGVLAITFSLAIFSIQYAADKGTTKILNKFSREPTYRYSSILLSIFSLVLFIFAVLPYRSIWIFVEYLIAFIFLTFTFIILILVFRKTIDLVDPLKSIQRLFFDFKKYFEQTEKNIQNLLKQGVFKDALNEVKTKNNIKMDDEEFLTTSIFYHTPELLKVPRSIIFDIFNTIKEFLSRKKHDVTDYGFLVVANCVGVYMKTRKKSTDSSNIFSSSSDKFLVDVYEKLKDLNLMTLQARDIEGLKQNLYCFRAICLLSLQFKSIVNDDSTNATSDLAVGYMSRNVLDAVKLHLEDIGLEGARVLGEIGNQIDPKCYMTVLTVTNNLTDLATTAMANNSLITVDACSNSISSTFSSKMIFTSERNEKLYYQRTPASMILDSVKKISVWYLEFGFEPSTNCSGLSGFYNIVNENSLPNFLFNYLKSIKEESEYDENIIMDIFHLYSDVGEKAGEKNSFLIHFLIQGVKQVTESLLELDYRDKNQKYTNALDDIIWLISIYWRIYDKQPIGREMRNVITTTGVDDLCYLGLKALNENDNQDFSEKITEQISSIASVDIRKRTDQYSAPRSIIKVLPIGILAEKKGYELSNTVIEQIEEFQKKFIDFHVKKKSFLNERIETQYRESLSKEMWDIYTENRRYQGNSYFSSESYFQNLLRNEVLTLEDIKTYLNKIEKKLYDREITDINESYFP